MVKVFNFSFADAVCQYLEHCPRYLLGIGPVVSEPLFNTSQKLFFVTLFWRLTCRIPTLVAEAPD